MNIGILGLGAMGNKMAEAIIEHNSGSLRLYSCASRTKAKTQAFQKKYGVPLAYQSYEDLLKDPNTELIYIATPPCEHYRWMKEAILRRKNVLCEKPFVSSILEAKELFALAEDHGVFIGEALWTSYMESRDFIDQVLESDKILSIEAVFDKEMRKDKLADFKLGYGALADLGIYPLSFVYRHVKDNLIDIQVHTRRRNTNNCDVEDEFTLIYPEFKAHIHCQADAEERKNYAIIETENLTVTIYEVNNPRKIEIKEKETGLLQAFEYNGSVVEQLEDAFYAIKSKKNEPTNWKHADTLAMLKIFEEIYRLSEEKPIEE